MKNKFSLFDQLENNIKTIEEIDAKVIYDISTDTFMDKTKRIMKCIIFFVGSGVISLIASFLIYFLYIASIFFSTFILWVS